MELEFQKRNADDGELSRWLPDFGVFPEIKMFFEKERMLKDLTATYLDGSSITFRKKEA